MRRWDKERRADTQAEARPNATALRISRTEQGQVLATCGSCPDVQLTDPYVAGWPAPRFTAAPVKPKSHGSA